MVFKNTILLQKNFAVFYNWLHMDIVFTFKLGYSNKRVVPTHMLSFFTVFDFPLAWQLFFQDPATIIMEYIIDLHHDIIFFLILIIVFVLYMLVQIILKFTQDNTTES